MNNSLVQFIYLLLRDYLPAGVVNAIVENICDDEVVYSNEHLEAIARDIASSLVDDSSCVRDHSE